VSLSIAFSKSNSTEQSNRDSSSFCPIRDLNLDFKNLNLKKHVRRIYTVYCSFCIGNGSQSGVLYTTLAIGAVSFTNTQALVIK